MSGYRQDVAPRGGYSPVSYKRIPGRELVKAPILIGGQIALFLVSWPIYLNARRRFEKDKVEMRSGSLALEPLLLAERDRIYLKEIGKNRKFEEEIMGDVRGWEVGTWFGESIYKTTNKWMDPTYDEFVGFARPKAQRYEKYRKSYLSGS